MKFWLTGILCLLELLSHAQQTDNSAAERELLGLERTVKLQAFESKNLKILGDVLDNSFILIDPSGKYYSKADLLAYINSVDLLQCVTEGMAVRLHGNTGIVTGLYRIKTVLHGKPYFEQGRFVDTWLLENGKWKAIASIDVPSQ